MRMCHYLSLLFFCIFMGQTICAKESEPEWKEFNDACGVPVFSATSIWEERAATVASRVVIPQLTANKHEAVYQCYSSEKKPYQLFGEDVICATMYAYDEKPTYFYFVFANKGDIQDKDSKATAIRHKIIDDFNDLRKRLTKLLGKSFPVKFSTPYSFEGKIEGWKSGDAVITLSNFFGKVTELRIMPLEMAKKGTIAEGVAVTAEDLESRVQSKENGDTYIDQLLMIDQGGKGYCVPATSERFLRYYGFNVEQYILAVKMASSGKRGTSLTDCQDVIADFFSSKTYTFKKVADEPTIEKIKPYIDQGYPLIWSRSAANESSELARARAMMRGKFSSTEEYREQLDREEKKTVPMLKNIANGHNCLIVGYNEKTREIAFSDSWGKGHEVCWITEREARVISIRKVDICTFVFKNTGSKSSQKSKKKGKDS